MKLSSIEEPSRDWKGCWTGRWRVCWKGRRRGSLMGRWRQEKQMMDNAELRTLISAKLWPAVVERVRSHPHEVGGSSSSSLRGVPSRFGRAGAGSCDTGHPACGGRDRRIHRHTGQPRSRSRSLPMLTPTAPRVGRVLAEVRGRSMTSSSERFES